jgi:hypothetical protein
MDKLRKVSIGHGKRRYQLKDSSGLLPLHFHDAPFTFLLRMEALLKADHEAVPLAPDVRRSANRQGRGCQESSSAGSQGAEG